ncbi:fluoride efflux transporter CrcB [Brevibacillus sp. SYSU BS000544]|uniref:fluoride efflux transporter CrcB n=1 Tax=Brevibacillus sp. SYSU BS000544 TaxID=3416443 RepID=UPI003CE548B6
MNWLAVAVGGAIGSVLRYMLSLLLNQPNLPYGTWMANGVGSLLIGMFFVWGKQKGIMSPVLYIFLTTGIMGGFTTFSTFSLEVVQFIQSGMWERAFVYSVLSLGVGLVGVFLGIVAGRQFFL